MTRSMSKSKSGYSRSKKTKLCSDYNTWSLETCISLLYEVQIARMVHFRAKSSDSQTMNMLHRSLERALKKRVIGLPWTYNDNFLAMAVCVLRLERENVEFLSSSDGKRERTRSRRWRFYRNQISQVTTYHHFLRMLAARYSKNRIPTSLSWSSYK